jgi:hypothetical protein
MIARAKITVTKYDTDIQGISELLTGLKLIDTD